MSPKEADELGLWERTTIGYFVSQDSKCTRIAHTWDAPSPENGDQCFCDVTIIWTACVKKLRYIERSPKKAKPQTQETV
jgi:hypothetical protein